MLCYRPLPSELLEHGLFAEMKPYEVALCCCPPTTLWVIKMAPFLLLLMDKVIVIAHYVVRICKCRHVAQLWSWLIQIHLASGTRRNMILKKNYEIITVVVAVLCCVLLFISVFVLRLEWCIVVQAGGWSSDLQMLSTTVRCLNLELPTYDEAFNESGNTDGWLCKQTTYNGACEI